MKLLRIWGLLKCIFYYQKFYNLFGAGGRGAVISKSNFSIVFGLLPTGVLGYATGDNPKTLV